jgi:hypothetical protein
VYLNYFTLPSLDLGFVYTKMDLVFAHSKATNKNKRNVLLAVLGVALAVCTIVQNDIINNQKKTIFPSLSQSQDKQWDIGHIPALRNLV